MSKKLMIWSILIIFLVPFAFANLNVNPINNDITLIVGKESNLTINLFNNFTFIIYNVSVDSDSIISMEQIGIILPNTSANATFKFRTDSLFNGQSTKKIKFRYTTNINQPPKTVNVQVTDSRYEPTIIEVFEGDTVNWVNNGSVTHTATEDSIPPLFDFSISPGSSSSYLFNNLGQVNYHDETLFFGGSVIILNKTTSQFVTDPNLYPSIIFNINSQYPNSTLNMDLFETNFTVAWNGTIDGALRILNPSLDKAFNIRLTGDWIRFAENNFDLNAGNSRLVVFTISPIITNTLDTNRNYTRTIKLTSSNTNEVNKDLFIHVPFGVVPSDINLSKPELLNILALLEQQVAELKNALNQSGPQIIYRESSFNINASEAEIKDALLNTRSTRDSLERLSANQQSQNDAVNTQLTNQAVDLNQTREELVNVNNTLNTLRTWLVFIVGFLALVFIIINIIGIIDKYQGSILKRKLFFNK